MSKKYKRRKKSERKRKKKRTKKGKKESIGGSGRPNLDQLREIGNRSDLQSIFQAIAKTSKKTRRTRPKKSKKYSHKQKKDAIYPPSMYKHHLKEVKMPDEMVRLCEKGEKGDIASYNKCWKGAPGKGKLEYGKAYEVIGDNVEVYRIWNSTNLYEKGGSPGNWWTFNFPKSNYKMKDYREKYAICPEWSPLDILSKAILKKGSIIIIGNSQSVECIGEGVEYGSSLTQQVYVIDPINDLSSPKTLGDLIMTFK